MATSVLARGFKCRYVHYQERTGVRNSREKQEKRNAARINIALFYLPGTTRKRKMITQINMTLSPFSWPLPHCPESGRKFHIYLCPKTFLMWNLVE
jgi:hypothetical protein